MSSEYKSPLEIKRLASDTDYYNNIFKKTERIVSVVFYVLSFEEVKSQNQRHLDNLSSSAFKTQEVSLLALNAYAHQAQDNLFALQQSLVALKSALTLAAASRIVSNQVLELIGNDIDTVQRRIQYDYLGIEAPNMIKEEIQKETFNPPATKKRTPQRATSRPQRSSIPGTDISSDAHLVYSQLTDRATRIKTVLEAKPEATIKDLAEVITDISEKTIQRELNSLIEKGQVIRQGERRWSKYSLAS
jgi:DNA-binding transcriptional ArsR family regulator